jgi:hypothetical protein
MLIEGESTGLHKNTQILKCHKQKEQGVNHRVVEVQSSEILTVVAHDDVICDDGAFCRPLR